MLLSRREHVTQDPIRKRCSWLDLLAGLKRQWCATIWHVWTRMNLYYKIENVFQVKAISFLNIGLFQIIVSQGLLQFFIYVLNFRCWEWNTFSFFFVNGLPTGALTVKWHARVILGARCHRRLRPHYSKGLWDGNQYLIRQQCFEEKRIIGEYT